MKQSVARAIAEFFLIVGLSIIGSQVLHDKIGGGYTAVSLVVVAIGAFAVWWWRDVTPFRGLSLVLATVTAGGTGVFLSAFESYPFARGTVLDRLRFVPNSSYLGSNLMGIRVSVLAAIVAAVLVWRLARYTPGWRYRRVREYWNLGALVIAFLILIGVAVARLRRRDIAPVSVSVSQVSPRERNRSLRRVWCPNDMVLVLGGEFRMGATDGDPDAHDNERPVHLVRLSSFCIDRTEVTVAAFRRYWSHQETHAPAGRIEYPQGRTITVSRAPARPLEHPYCTWSATPGRVEQHPINCVNWNTAQAFCTSLGRRLPSEAEWEYAARGVTSRRYSWGNTPPRDQLCWWGTVRRNGTCVVGSYPTGATSEGLLDMSGNVWEWVADSYPYRYPANLVSPQVDPLMIIEGPNHVLRGGGWDSHIVGRVTTTARYARDDSGGYNDLGFRCARGVLQEEVRHSDERPHQFVDASLPCPCWLGTGDYCATNAWNYARIEGCTIPVAADSAGSLLRCIHSQWTLQETCSRGCQVAPQGTNDRCK